MLKVNSLHICEKIIVEEKTGNVSIINIFDNINAQNFPATYPKMSVFAGFENNNPGIYDFELIFLDEKGEILKIQAKINIGVNCKGNWAYNVVGYQIPREATQKIKLNYEGETIYTGYLTINNK